MKQAAMECFNTLFAPDVLHPYHVMLQQGRFRLVWLLMCDVFSGRAGGMSSASAITEQLISYTYDIDYAMTDNIQYIDVVCEQLRIFNIEIGDLMRMQYLVSGIKRSPAHHELKQVANNAMLNDFTYEELKSALKQKFLSLQSQQALHKHRGHPKPSGSSATSGSFAAAGVEEIAGAVIAALSSTGVLRKGNTQPGKPGKKARVEDGRKCTHCGKAGHTVDTCFKVVPCPACNKTGHGEWNCPVKKAAGAQAAAAAAAGAGGAGGAGPAMGLSQMFAAHHGKK
jgi:hypothetical protein